MVYHPDAEYLEDVKLLSRYVADELNIREVDLSADESACGVRWKLSAEWAVLGRKLRKNMGKVKNALPSVTSTAVKDFLKCGEIEVAGEKLVQGDLTASRFVDAESLSLGDGDFISKSDSDVVVLLDCKILPEFIEEATAKELLNRIQRARKEARFLATDEVDVYIDGSSPETTEALLQVSRAQAAVMTKTLGRLPLDARQMSSHIKSTWSTPTETPAEIGDYTFGLHLVKLT